MLGVPEFTTVVTPVKLAYVVPEALPVLASSVKEDPKVAEGYISNDDKVSGCNTVNIMYAPVIAVVWKDPEVVK